MGAAAALVMFGAVLVLVAAILDVRRVSGYRGGRSALARRQVAVRTDLAAQVARIMAALQERDRMSGSVHS